MKKTITTLLAVIILGTVLSTFAQEDVPSRIGYFHIGFSTPATPNKCLTLGGPAISGTPIVQFDCNNGANQFYVYEDYPPVRFRFIIKSNMNKNLCIGITNNLHANAHELLRLVPCRVNGQVQFGALWIEDEIGGYLGFRIRANQLAADHSQTCIDVPDASLDNGVLLQLFPCGNRSNQMWQVE